MFCYCTEFRYPVKTRATYCDSHSIPSSLAILSIPEASTKILVHHCALEDLNSRLTFVYTKKPCTYCSILRE